MTLKSMKTSINGLNLIKKYEGLRLQAYLCPAGIPTIGYGHTSGVAVGDTCTQDQADQWLKDDLKKSEDAVKQKMEIYDLNQNQFDALVSFTYNCGPGNLDKLTAHGTRNLNTISDKLLLYTKANGKVLEGLVKRRKDEKKLFNKPCEQTVVSPKFFEKPKKDCANCHIDTILKCVGADQYYDKDKIAAWQKRIPIAQANGIPNYQGSASHNIILRNLALDGKLKIPED